MVEKTRVVGILTLVSYDSDHFNNSGTGITAVTLNDASDGSASHGSDTDTLRRYREA